MLTPADALKIYTEEHEILDRWYAKGRKQLGKKVACRAGCAHCCTYDQPPLNKLESAALVHYCQITPGFEDVLEKAIRGGEEVVLLAEQGIRNLGRDTSPNQTCPFLDREKMQCRIYNLRPAACIFAYSPDADACRDSVGSDGLVAWTVSGDELEETTKKMWQLLPNYARTKMTRLLGIRATNNRPWTMMLSAAMAIVLRPDLKERFVAAANRWLEPL